jgi:hypothetical protein
VSTNIQDTKLIIDYYTIMPARAGSGNRGRGGSSGGFGWAVGTVPLSGEASSVKSTTTTWDMGTASRSGSVRDISRHYL